MDLLPIQTNVVTPIRYGHVLFPENVHEPAVTLSEQLVRGVGEGWAARVFYSDNGSTATEVAIKMAFRKYIKVCGWLIIVAGFFFFSWIDGWQWASTE